MVWIKTVSEEEAQGRVRRVYEGTKKRAGGVAEIVKSMSLNEASFAASMRFYSSVMFAESPLGRQLRELVATVVSVENECHY